MEEEEAKRGCKRRCCHAMPWPVGPQLPHAPYSLPLPPIRFDPGRIHTYIYRRRWRRGRNISERWSPRKATDRPTAYKSPRAARSGILHHPAAAVAACPGACCVAAVEAAAAVVDRRLVCDYSGRCCGFSCWPRHRRCCFCDTKRRGGHVGNVVAGWSAAAARARRGQGAAQVDAPAARPLRARRGPARRRRQGDTQVRAEGDGRAGAHAAPPQEPPPEVQAGGEPRPRLPARRQRRWHQRAVVLLGEPAGRVRRRYRRRAAWCFFQEHGADAEGGAEEAAGADRGAAAPTAEDRGAGEVPAVRAAPGAGDPRQRPQPGLAGRRGGRQGRALGAGLHGGDGRMPVLLLLLLLLLPLAVPDAPPLRRQLRHVLLLGGRRRQVAPAPHVRWYARLLRRRAAGAAGREYIPAEPRSRGRGRHFIRD